MPFGTYHCLVLLVYVLLGDAMYEIGWMYYNGLGVPKDDAKALEWLNKAANLGNEQAEFLAEMIRG